MSSLYFPLASLLVSFLLLIVFFDKERMINSETKIYTRMIGINILETLTAIAIIILAKVIGSISVVYYLDRLDFMLITLWCANLTKYVFAVSIKDINIKVLKSFYLFEFLLCILLLVAPFEVINKGQSIDTTGLAPTLVGIYCGLFTIAMLSVLIIRIISKQIDKSNIKKYYPLFVFIVLITLSLVVRKFWPTMVLEPFMISFINLIMFFTIENPDIKMLEEISKSKDLVEKYNNDKSIFIFNMSQKIKYPLKVIEQRVDELSDYKTEQTEELINDIKYSTNSISNIVYGALNIDSMSSNKIKIIDNKYNLKNILEEIVIKVRTKSEKNNVMFINNIDKALPTELYGDSIRLKQIITKISDTVLDNTSKGYIELDINSIVQNDICRLIIVIKTSSENINSEKVQGTINNGEDSNETIQNYLNKIGGTITIETDNKNNTEISIIIDQKVVDNYDRIDNLVNYYKNENEQKRILIISEQEDYVFYKKRLESLYDINFSKNGEEGLNTIRSGEKFNLLIVKEEMDKLDAKKIIAKLKEISNFDTPVFLLTENDKTMMELKSYGFTDYITKNLSNRELIEKIKDSI